MAGSISAEDFLSSVEPPADAILDGAALVRLYWIVQGRAKEVARKEAFWAATNDALAAALAELTRKTRDLDAARAELVELNRHLEERVESQVKEIVKRAREVEELNAQLRLQVQERSRELAAALRRLSDQHELDVVLPSGALIGDRARVVKILGQGAMGVVYEADDLVTGSAVALKVSRAALPGGVDSVHRFLVEAAAAAAISHPAIVKTLAVDVTPDGRLFQIMEYVHGITLRSYLARSLSPGVAASIGRAIAEGLAAAHAQGVVHRDIKPGNIMLGSDPPYLRILDFGLAKVFGATELATRTFAGDVMGTPAYMSPEQLDDSASVTAATDIYSLGVVLHEMLLGERPYAAASLESLYLRLDETPKNVRELRSDIPSDLADLVARCLAKTAAARPGAAEIAATLDEIARRLGAPPLGDALRDQADRPADEDLDSALR